MMRFPTAWSGGARVGLILALVGLVQGCGGGSGADQFVPVRGQVTYKAEPLRTGTVILVADTAKGNTTKHEPRGPIDDQGYYEVSTAGQPGAPPGWYRVAVIAHKQTDPAKRYAIPESLLPKKYGNAKTSELTLEVTDKAAEKAYDLTLK